MSQKIDPPQDLQALSDKLHAALNLKHELVDDTGDLIIRWSTRPNTPSMMHRLIGFIQSKSKLDNELTGFYHCFAIVKEVLNLPEPSEGELVKLVVAGSLEAINQQREILFKGRDETGETS